MSSRVVNCVRVTALGVAVMASPAALAGSTDTSDVACGSTAAGWNAPKGALVLNRGGEGPVAAVLDAVGEYRTHSMLSHGPGGLVSHETMHSPGTNGWPTYCSLPLKVGELRTGYPGASRVNQGAIYQFLYGGSGQQYIAYQRSKTSAGYDTKGEAIVDWLLHSMPASTATSKQDSAQTLSRYLTPSGAPVNYTLYQYRDLESVNYGGFGWNNGMVCSTFIAHAQYRAGFSAVEAYTYNHAKLVNGGNALYASVEQQCKDGLGFWGGSGAAFSCFEGSICDDAARQVRNCMAAGRCDTDDNSVWTSIANDSTTVARSISPDRLGGWSGHPYTGSGVSVWAYDYSNTLQWNSGGNVYGCWF